MLFIYLLLFLTHTPLDGWNVYHVVGLCLMVLSLIVWAFDLKTYFDRANKFL